VPFYHSKGHLLRVKRASFTLQKGIFYNAKEPLWNSQCDLFLHHQFLFYLLEENQV